MDKDALRTIFSDASGVGWSLRSDVQLQEWLEGFAERLKERTKEVGAEVDRLGTETGNVELHLQNSFNSLRALSATQFIENRVDEVDEVFVNRLEQPIKQSRVEGYDSQIIPRYKEAVLVAWEAFEGFRTSKTSDVKSRRNSQASQTRPSMKLPHIIGTEEFTRDIHCGLGDFKFLEVTARASSSEPVESGSDTDRDEARMAAEMVGGRTWLEGEWSASESETSGHQGGVLEPAVSAALDFKAMLEAALRGPSFPYDGGIIPSLEDIHGPQHSFVDSTLTLDAQDTGSNAPRTRSEPGEINLDGGSSTKYGETPVEDNVQHPSQGLASETMMEVNKTVFLQPPPIQMPPVLNRNDYAYITGLMGPQSPSTSTPTYTPALNSPRDGFPDDLERSLGISPRANPLSQGITNIAKIQNTIGSSLLRTEENKPQPASQFRPPMGVTEDLPMPTLPDGLFQGLQVAIQARQLRSQSIQRDETSAGKEVTERSDAVGEVRSPISAEKSVTSRLAPLKLNVKDNRGPFSRSKVETTSRLQKESKGASPSVISPGPVLFQGGLFDDDDDNDDMDESSHFSSKEITQTPKDGPTKFGDKPSSPFLGPLVASSTMARQGLFDGLGDLSIGSPSGSEAAANSGQVERSNATQQSSLSLPDWKDSKRSSVLKKSLFGDSDNDSE
ncbi:hypothetical protein KC19_11G101700 [Ceratodon purpureus]|uniref:Uncharacterized protein n=1 Tax=Ceratodon purpureus TaxID=3225 RepID=A0A8T0GCI4_CERPU|nr:hypothetical protein KC19_11G101700 [Ceratodon purpureus]KAG0557096.1 hypothetical protein KC19_11G101700 [Ceratodon purpureus]